MRKKRKLCLLLTMYLLLCFTLPVFAATNNFITTNNYIPGTHNIAPVTTRASGQWIQASDGRWWYKHSDGSYTVNDWEYIDGEWYHFDSQGWMQTGTLVINKITYKLNSSGALYYTQLPITRERQQQTMWCWVTCARMVGKYYNPSTTKSQSDMVTFIKGSSINEGGTDSEIKQAIEYICNKNAVANNTNLSFTEAWNEINSGDPFIAHISWNNTDIAGLGHAITCYAFDKENFNGLAYFHDPWENTASYNVSYNVLLSGCSLPTGTGKCTSAIWIK